MTLKTTTGSPARRRWNHTTIAVVAALALLLASCGAEAEVRVEESAEAVIDAAETDTSPETSNEAADEPAAEEDESAPAEAPPATAVPTAVPEPAQTEDSEDPEDTEDTTEEPSTDSEREAFAADFVDLGYTPEEATCIVDAIFVTEPSEDSSLSRDEQELILIELVNQCATPLGAATGSPAPGTDAELDVLWTACSDGSPDDCDLLFAESPIDSDYETFAATCGGRVVIFADCSVVLTGASNPGSDSDSDFDSDGVFDLSNVPEPGSPAPGDDADFDVLWERCSAEDAEACDELYFSSPAGSVYEAYGFTCGGRTEVDECADLFAP